MNRTGHSEAQLCSRAAAVKPHMLPGSALQFIRGVLLKCCWYHHLGFDENKGAPLVFVQYREPACVRGAACFSVARCGCHAQPGASKRLSFILSSLRERSGRWLSERESEQKTHRIYDSTKAVDLVYQDFQKVFDKVPDERLVAKVEAHGIRGNYSRWIRNWLTGRTQRVVIHDETSDPALVTSGVPQGSVLGPLLFIIYINDLDVGIISKIKFADDTKLCHRAFTERDRATIQSDLNRLLQWTETWQMSFNVEKCSLGRLVSEYACKQEDPGSNPAADMVDAAGNTAWDLGKTTE
ncbi:Reverse transcriptase domain [Trinorchestia longiramus]|nr:Reverse transcriptase domain [Trinorchestia longiramus]